MQANGRTYILLAVFVAMAAILWILGGLRRKPAIIEQPPFFLVRQSHSVPRLPGIPQSSWRPDNVFPRVEPLYSGGPNVGDPNKSSRQTIPAPPPTPAEEAKAVTPEEINLGPLSIDELAVPDLNEPTTEPVEELAPERTEDTDVLGEEELPLVPQPRLRRLPAIEEGGTGSDNSDGPSLTLPPQTDLPGEDEDDGSEGEVSVVDHGDGTVRIEIPGEWDIEEVPFGREIRLAFRASEISDRRGMPNDGMWLCFHLRNDGVAPTREQTLTKIQDRIQASFGDDLKSQILTGRYANFPAVVADFEVALERKQVETLVVGRHILIETPWGWCEVHLRTTKELAPTRMPELLAILETLSLNAPPSPPIAAPHIADAQGVLGRWKAHRSQIRFAADGEVTFHMDTRTPLTMAMKKRDTKDKLEERRLQGKFEAQGDLLRIVWDDGSKLNFRWKKNEDSLLLTDHDGKMSIMRRVLD